MKNTLHTLLLLLATTLSFANGVSVRFDNSDITLSNTGKALEVNFENTAKSPNVSLLKLGEKSNSVLDFDTTGNTIIVDFNDYTKGSYVLTLENEFNIEDVLLYVEDSTLKIIERRIINKPVYQLKDNKFNVIVNENEIPVNVLIESLNGSVVHNSKYSVQDLNKTTFIVEEDIDKCVVYLNYMGKKFTKTINLF